MVGTVPYGNDGMVTMFLQKRTDGSVQLVIQVTAYFVALHCAIECQAYQSSHLKVSRSLLHARLMFPMYCERDHFRHRYGFLGVFPIAGF